MRKQSAETARRLREDGHQEVDPREAVSFLKFAGYPDFRDAVWTMTAVGLEYDEILSHCATQPGYDYKTPRHVGSLMAKFDASRTGKGAFWARAKQGGYVYPQRSQPQPQPQPQSQSQPGDFPHCQFVAPASSGPQDDGKGAAGVGKGKSFLAEQPKNQPSDSAPAPAPIKEKTARVVDPEKPPKNETSEKPVALPKLGLLSNVEGEAPKRLADHLPPAGQCLLIAGEGGR